MDMEHRVWPGAIQTLEKRPLGTCAYVLLLSHFTRALESPENKARIVVCQMELQILLVECKVAGSIPERTVFAFQVFKLEIMFVQFNVPILMPVVYKIVQIV